ncbi:MAG TPA: DUF2339 domain-containing protein [Terriglobales bacterium]|jgi:uncharacterized membrane protein|nr:DUF2339 domain-containing protein [Terriglobales bacterium]
MPNPQDELEALRQQVAALTARIFRLEQRLGIAAEAQRPEAAPPIAPPAAAASPALPISEPQPSSASAPPMFAQAAPPAERGNLESKIGKLWFSWIGIIAILGAVSYFLKLAFDSGMIGPLGRVAIGIVAGTLVVLWSERFRRKRQAFFSYSLKAVGIGVLYFSLWGAHYFNLIPVEAVFAAMIIVTSATVVMAFAQDAQILALYALIGGFLSPVLVSTGKNEEIVLFTYVAILDLGVLALAVLKPWRRLLWGSFIGTIILYVGWGAEHYSRSERPTTLVFASIFAAIFAAIPLVTPYYRSSKFPGPSITLTLLPFFNAAGFFLALYAMYEEETATLTWFALGLAAIYLAISNVFMRRFAEKDTRKVVALLHVAIAIAFITIAIPLKLNAHWITIGWLIESAVLLWISDRTKIAVLRYLAVTILVLAIFRVFVFDSSEMAARLVFNARFATYAVAVAVLGGIIILGSREVSKTESGKTGKWAIRLAGVVLTVLVLVSLTLEAHDYFSRQSMATTLYDGRNWELYMQNEIAERFSYSIIWLVVGAALMVTGFWKRSAFVRWQALVLIAFTIGKVLLYDSSELNRVYRVVSFLVLGIVLLGISYAYQRDWLKLSPQANKSAKGTSA